ncbi:MAG: alpha/beta hydrolase family protein [Acidimicrobiales bacterium]
MRLATAAVVGCTLLVACGGSSGPAQPVAAPDRHPVTMRWETFVDATRPTDAVDDTADKSDRTFETEIVAPEGTGGPFPLIVFSHGNGVSSPVRYDALFRAWAGAGYVIAAPKFPLSSTSMLGAAGDVVNQPADVSFLITEMTRRNPGLVDGNRVAVAGHSLGAMTSLAVGYNRCCIDNRVKAVVSLAGSLIMAFPEDRWFPGGQTPLLVVHGDDDKVVRIEGGQKAFDNAPPPKAMLTVIGGDHGRPYGGGLATTENPERLGADPQGDTRLVNATVVGFLDQYVRDDPASFTKVRRALDSEIDVRLQYVS